MLHDPTISGRDPRSRMTDRRRSKRSPADAELVVRWHHDPDTSVRYPVLDLGRGGARILCGTSLPRLLSGTAVKLLPQGEVLHRMCTVLWCRPAGDGLFEVGLRFD